MDIDKWLTFNVHLYAIQITLQHMLKKIATCVDATLHERFLFEFNIKCSLNFGLFSIWVDLVQK